MDYLKALERAILYIEHHLGEDTPTITLPGSLTLCWEKV